MKSLLAAVLILFCLTSVCGADSAAFPPLPPPKPPIRFEPPITPCVPANCLPGWQKRPIIPSWYYQKRCYVAYWYLTQNTGVDAIGSPVTWQSYEPQWACR